MTSLRFENSNYVKNEQNLEIQSMQHAVISFHGQFLGSQAWKTKAGLNWLILMCLDSFVGQSSKQLKPQTWIDSRQLVKNKMCEETEKAEAHAAGAAS